MKKDLFAAGLLAVILALSMLNTGRINSLCDDLDELVDLSAGAAARGDWEESRQALDKAVSLWKAQEEYTGIVLRHTDIETLTDDLYELAEHIYTRDGAAAKAAASLVREHLKSIKKMESINPGSIF